MTKTDAPPILDFSAFYGDDSNARSQLIQDVRDSCLKNGFFQITGHRVPQELQARTVKWAKRFFELPLEEKKKIDRTGNPYNRGYELMQSHMSEPGSAPDLKEGIFIGPEIAPDHPYCVQQKLNCGPNQWPQGMENLDEFQRTSMEYYAAVFDLAEDILAVLALTMEYEEDFFGPFTDGAVAMLRYLHYPPQRVGETEGRGTGAHRDYSCITLLLQDEVEPTPGAYVVNLGNLFSRMTNENYKSALHRVINKSGLERYSIPFFFTGNPDYVCQCLSRFEKEGEPAKYPPATVQDVVRAAVKGTVDRARRYNEEKQKAMEGGV
ncbi:hypothetical protein FE257_006960 [Aspergillus nanangensis]|uniref:Fe2OG dioxygenase domain-containing protein n=1 Tax=Aspergillus nanangensis TaxID=2582783 RepID=A0AAD4GUP0_ASPNN|nr:hypothetical protein FE257_006960 [Aspergillus nanangensis]